jgi:hypothetical protein
MKPEIWEDAKKPSRLCSGGASELQLGRLAGVSRGPRSLPANAPPRAAQTPTPEKPLPVVCLSPTFVENLQEVQRRRRGDGKPARAMQQPDAGEIAHGTLDVVPLCEVL